MITIICTGTFVNVFYDFSLFAALTNVRAMKTAQLLYFIRFNSAQVMA